MREYRPKSDDWPGLVVGIDEDHIINDIALANDLSKNLGECNVRLAIADFGKGKAAVSP